MLKFTLPALILLGVLLVISGRGGSDDNAFQVLVTGWSIGKRADGTAAIFHTGLKRGQATL